MKQSGIVARIVMLSAAGVLAACSGRAALAQLATLEEQACACRGGAECRREVEALAAAWVADHGTARISDLSRVESLVNAIAACDLEVARALVEVP